MPAGRPSDYRPEYCATVLEAGSLGKSKAWIAAELGVSRQTLDAWIKGHPEFLDAMDAAMAKSQQWWEDAGQNNLATQGFNTPIWSRSMAARFPADWREVKASEVSGPNGGPVQSVSHSPDEWASKLKADTLRDLAGLAE